MSEIKYEHLKFDLATGTVSSQIITQLRRPLKDLFSSRDRGERWVEGKGVGRSPGSDPPYGQRNDTDASRKSYNEPLKFLDSTSTGVVQVCRQEELYQEDSNEHLFVQNSNGFFVFLVDCEPLN